MKRVIQLNGIVCVALVFLAAPQIVLCNETDATLTPITPGPSMTLKEALAATDQRNTSLQAMRLELERAQIQISATWAGLLPHASAQLQYTHADHDDTADMGGASIVTRRQDDLSGNLTASISLVNLQAWRNVGIARQAKELTRFNVEEMRREMLLATSQAYYLAEVSHSLVDMYAEQVHSAKEQLDVAQKKVHAGAGLRLDEIRAENDLADAIQEYEDALLSLDTSRDTLATLTGTDGLPLPKASPDLLSPSGDAKGMIDAAKGQRPDLAAKKAAIELAEKQVASARSAFVPTLSAGWQGSYQITEPADMGDTDRSRWSTFLTLDIPLFNGSNIITTQNAKVDLRQATIEEEDAKREESKEIRQGYREYLSAVNQVHNSQRKVVLAREGLKLAATAYKAGSGSSLDVTEARRSVVTAEVSLATARLQSKVSLAALYNALGKDLRDMAERGGSQLTFHQ
ncbi:MAG: TolC family protein [Deltaproteobacteria bacterium]|nr:TolC family protein [Deltaproteobacteria bacterium]